MQILPVVDIFKLERSSSNLAKRAYIQNIFIPYTPVKIVNVPVLANLRDRESNSNYLVTGTGLVEGVLRDGEKDLKAYYPVYLYSTSSGVLLKKSYTDANGYYRFDQLRANHSYMIVSYDRESVKNATIIEFTLKEGNT